MSIVREVLVFGSFFAVWAIVALAIPYLWRVAPKRLTQTDSIASRGGSKWS